MDNGRQFVRHACIGVGGRAHDDGGDGQTADKRADDVACALRAQFAVGVGDAAVGVEEVGGFDAEQGFNRGDDGDGDAGHPDVAVAET